MKTFGYICVASGLAATILTDLNIFPATRNLLGILAIINAVLFFLVGVTKKF